MISRFLQLLLFLSFFVPYEANAFVFYLVGDKVMRWIPGSSRYHTNVVNSTNKKIRYFIATDAYSNANRTAELNAVRACFDQWQAVPGAKIAFEEAGLVPAGVGAFFDNTNVVFWAKTILTDNIMNRPGFTEVVFSYDDGSILEADIILNGKQYQWFTDFNDKSNQGRYIESVLLHEIGHFLGLDHSPAGGATVAVGAAGIGTEAGLSADDIAAMRFFYPDGVFKSATIKGRVSMNGGGILGAVVAVQDSKGNIAGATVTRDTGDYEIYSLPAGTYTIRVSPLDPANASNASSLLRGVEIAPDYELAVTGFKPTGAFTVTLTNNQVLNTNFVVTAGNPPFRIASLSKPDPAPDLVSIVRYAVSLQQGQSNYYVSVTSPTILANSVLTVSGDGITMGPTVYKPNRFPGQHTLTAAIHVSSNATPGLRTFVVQNGTNFAYAHGYLEVAAPMPDFNFDGLDDRFQRKYWARWTAAEAAPSADPDQDKFSNDFEFRTGTNPTNALSKNFLVEKVKMTDAGAEVTWTADLGKKYQVFGRPAFAAGATWQAVGLPVTANKTTMTILDPALPGQRPREKYYRIQLVP